MPTGANFNLPQATYLNRYQLREAFSWTLGKHALRLGGEFQRYTAHGIINVFGTGTVILVSDFGFADLNGDGAVNDLDIPIAVALKSSAPVSPVPIPHIANNYLAGYVQDDWRVRPNLTLNLGLRWEYDTDLLGNDSSHGPCPDLTSEPDRPCVWLANVIDLHRNPDKKSFGPRVGFAWDPFGKGKTVVRGGYGIYYDRIILEAPSLERVQDNRQLTVAQFAGSSCTFPGNPGPPSLGLCFAGIPGEGFAPGSPTLADPFSGPNQTGGGGLIALSKDSHHPLFQQFSIGVQQQLGNNWLFSADGLHVFGYNQLIGQFLRNTDSTSPDISCSGNNVPCVVTDPLTGISDNVTELGSFAKSWYDGLIVSVQHRPTKLGRFTYLYNINYTFSKTLDYSDDDQLTNGNADEAVNLVEGTAGLAKEKGYASSDERHRLTLFGQLQMPWGFSFSPIYTFGSGVPANTALSGLPVAFNPDQTVTSRIPILSRNAIGRSIKNSDQLNAIIDGVECIAGLSRAGSLQCWWGYPHRARRHRFLQPVQLAGFSFDQGNSAGRAHAPVAHGRGVQHFQLHQRARHQQEQLRGPQHCHLAGHPDGSRSNRLLQSCQRGRRLLWRRRTPRLSICGTLQLLVRRPQDDHIAIR